MNSKSGLMAGKRGLIMGVANDRSIAWGIAKAVHDAGAEVAFTYQGEALQKRVKPLAESLGSSLVVPCDVTDDASLDATFDAVKKAWGTLDFVVHAIAFSDKEELKGQYVSTTRANFQQTMDISCYSFTAVAERARQLMPNGGSLLTLTYFGAERVMPHYNVMGVAKAALEAQRALSRRRSRQRADPRQRDLRRADQDARGVGHRRLPLHPAVERAQRAAAAATSRSRKSATPALYLLTDLARGVTGEMHHVDGGYHMVGMMAPMRAGELAKMLTDFRAQRLAMSHNSFGHLFRFTTWGESHGPAIGCVVDGTPPGIALAETDIQPWLDKRKPGQSRFVTQRREPDQVQILSGVFEGKTTGTPIALVIKNVDQRSQGLREIKDQFRPGHADYTYWANIRHPRLSRRRALLGARDRDARRRRRDRAQGAGAPAARAR